MIAAIIAAVVVVVVNLPFPSAEWSYRMFGSISELDKLNAYVVEEREDPYLGDAAPIGHWCKLVSYEGEEYRVAGYTFGSVLDALRFNQRNVWNEKLNPEIDNGSLDPSFWNEGFRSCNTLGNKKLAYYYETNALLIESRTASSKQMEAFQRWLAQDFTLEMPMAAVMAEFEEAG